LQNYTYTIKSINQKQFVIHDAFDDETCTLPIKNLDNFELPYANTCHSLQGADVNGKITIFDVNSASTDRYYLWTALTRATDFDLVTFFQHSDEVVKQSEQGKKKQYFKNKINDYKRKINSRSSMERKLYYCRVDKR